MSTGLHSAIKYDKQSWLVGIFYLCCLFPFVSPLPTETDTQPLFIVFATIIVTLHALNEGLHVRKYILLCMSALSLIYINTSLDYTVETGKSVSILAGILTFIAATRINDKQGYQLVKIAACIYFIYSCLIYLNASFFLSLQENFVRGVNVADFSYLEYRGSPALATEPGLLGGLLVFLLMQLKHFGIKINASEKEMVVYGIVIVLTILMTKSGTGYLYLMIYLILAYGHNILTKQYIRMFLLGASLIILALVVRAFANLEFDNRGFEIITSIFSSDSLYADTSVLKRLYDIRIGIESFFDYPFGAGINGVSAAVNELAFRHNLIRSNDVVGDISLVSGLSYYFVAYGLLGLLFILYIFIFESRAHTSHKVFALIFLSASYSPAFPAIWILLSQVSKNIHPVSSNCD